MLDVLQSIQHNHFVDLTLATRLASRQMSIDEVHATLRRLARAGRIVTFVEAIHYRDIGNGRTDQEHTPKGPYDLWLTWGWIGEKPNAA